MRMLGESFRDSEGFPSGPTLAVRWLSKAAQWGDGAAMRDMGDLWRQGKFVPADPVLALMAYRLAEGVGVPSATEARQNLERALQPSDWERALVAAQAWRVGQKLTLNAGQ